MKAVRQAGLCARILRDGANASLKSFMQRAPSPPHPTVPPPASLQVKILRDEERLDKEGRPRSKGMGFIEFRWVGGWVGRAGVMEAMQEKKGAEAMGPVRG